ncbi:MAG: hypothetical protein U0270_41215 [Labilithrix sp.]
MPSKKKIAQRSPERISRDEVTAAIAAAETLADHFTLYAQELRRHADDPAMIDFLLRGMRWANAIHGALRILDGIGDSKEALRCAFFGAVQNVADLQTGATSPASSAILAVRKHTITNGGAARYVQVCLSMLDPLLAARATPELIADAVNACLDPPPGGKWATLVRLWQKIAGEKISVEAAKVAMSKYRKSSVQNDALVFAPNR